MQELEAAGTFDDLTMLGPGEDDIDRQLRELSSGSAGRRRPVEMKAELGIGGGGGQGALEAGSAPPTERPAELGAPPRRPSSPLLRSRAAAPGAGQGTS